MKNILIAILVVFTISIGNLLGQDPALGNPSISPVPPPLGGDADMSFELSNNLTELPLSAGITIGITFVRATPSPPTGSGATYFTWTYFPSSNSYQGVQNAAIPGFTFGLPVVFPVEIYSDPILEGTQTGFNANFGNVAGITPPNITANDNVNVTNPIGPPIPVPVELMSFNGNNTEEGNLLYWRTASELNNAGFQVEKSPNGSDWKTIGWVEGKGTTELTNDYDLLDREPFVGDNYYRLKQIDYDGAFEYSKIINIEYRVFDVFIQVLPNPSPGDVKITVVNPNKEKMHITLFDSAGQLIWKSEVIRDMDLWKKQFNLTQKEMYFINVIIGDKTYSEKILIVDRA